MSRRLRLALVLGCLGVSALHLPRAAGAARAGLAGPYAERSAADRLADGAQAPSQAELRIADRRGALGAGVRAGT